MKTFPSFTTAAAIAALSTAALPFVARAQAQTPPAAPPPVPPVRVRPVPEPYAADEKPDFPGAVWEPASPFNFQKYDRVTTEHPINCIVIHDIEGSAISAVRWFQNPVARVTSHYVIGSDGTVYQLVKERDVAWHAGNGDINRRSVGIEHDGFAYRPGFYNHAEYEASARLVRSIALRYQIPRDRTHIFGHAEVPNAADPTKFGGSSGHTDPGPYWDWDYFMAMVRNDAAFVPAAAGAADQAATVTIKLHPGEKGEAVFSFTNTGDDAWPADTKPPRPNPEVRQAGPVYLGIANPAGQAGSSPAPGWISPQFAASPDGGDVPPSQTARFVVPLVGEAAAGMEQKQLLRLWKVFPAPHPPVPFGPMVSAAVFTVPWDITAPLPATLPAGWNEKTMGSTNERVFWRNVAAAGSDAKPDEVSWSVPLPVAGQWDVYMRVPEGLDKKTVRAPEVYHLPTSNGGINDAIIYPKQGEPTGSGEWQKVGRFFFDVPKPDATSLGVRPGAPVPAAPVVQGTVRLSPSTAAKTSGVLVAGDVRFVGPFPSVKSTPTSP